MGKEQEKKQQETQESLSEKEKRAADSKGSVSETWAEETIADLDDYIESQGIYLRQ